MGQFSQAHCGTEGLVWDSSVRLTVGQEGLVWDSSARLTVGQEGFSVGQVLDCFRLLWDMMRLYPWT